MFKVNNKNSRTTSLKSFLCFYCYLWTYLPPFSSVSIVDFELAGLHFVGFIPADQNLDMLEWFMFKHREKERKREKNM